MLIPYSSNSVSRSLIKAISLLREDIQFLDVGRVGGVNAKPSGVSSLTGHVQVLVQSIQARMQTHSCPSRGFALEASLLFRVWVSAEGMLAFLHLSSPPSLSSSSCCMPKSLIWEINKSLAGGRGGGGGGPSTLLHMLVPVPSKHKRTE